MTTTFSQYASGTDNTPANSPLGGDETFAGAQSGAEAYFTVDQAIALASKTLYTLAGLNSFVPEYDGQIIYFHDAAAGSAAGGRHGQFTYISGDQSANITADPQGGIWQPVNGDATGASGAVMRIVSSDALPEWYGATGDGTTDDTTAIQAAVNAHITPNGGKLYFPGKYLISSAITIPFSAGWVILGRSKYYTIIKQATDNTPIWKFTSNNTHSWNIVDMGFDYSKQQASTNTAACPFYFVGDSSAHYGYYNWTAKRLWFQNCSWCFGADSTLNFSSWGYDIDDIFVQPNVTGGIASWIPSTAIGMPNGHWGSIYARADSMVGPIFNMLAQKRCQMDNIEINQSNLGPTILKDDGGGEYVIGSIKTEVGTYTGSNGSALFEVLGSDLKIDTVSIQTLTFTLSSPYYIIKANGASHIGINYINIASSTAPTGDTVYLMGGALDISYGSYVNYLTSPLPSGYGLSNNPYDSAGNGFVVRAWMASKMSPDNGDASITIVEGDANIQLFDTALTANRTVTFPNTLSNQSFNGLWYRIVRTANSTGAYTLTVEGKALGAGEWVEVTYMRFAWVITGSGSL